MQSKTPNETRNVIPRWRSLNAMAPWELEQARALSNATQSNVSLYADDLVRWRQEGTIAAAADIFSTGLATSDKSLIWEGGLRLIANESSVESRLIDAVKREIAPTPDLQVVRRNVARLEQSDQYIRYTIRLLKRKIRDRPRDAVANLEIARLYAILGQYDQAEKWLMVANALAPNNRVILRAIVQFHDVIGQLEDSLPFLWRAEPLKYDPLVQAAEVAAAEMSGRGSRVAATLRRKLKGVSAVPKPQSEAAMALATLEQSSGLSERSVFRLVKAGLASPTENAVAQAIWVGDQSSRSLIARFPSLEIQRDAFEARANILFDNRQYDAALISAFRWSRDQPFQARPMAFICETAAIYSDKPEWGARYAEAIMSRHNGDWAAVNTALLLFNEIKAFDRAKDAAATLARLATSVTERAFASAGAGLLAFSLGDVASAQDFYIEAMKLTREAKRADLTFTAAAFYVLGEARFGFPDAKELADAIAMLDRVIKRLEAADYRQAEQLWAKLKERVAQSYQERRLGPEIGKEPRFVELPRIVEEI